MSKIMMHRRVVSVDCVERDATVNPMIFECSKLVEKKYNSSYDRKKSKKISTGNYASGSLANKWYKH